MIQENELKIGNQHILFDANMAEIKMTNWPYLFESYYLKQHRLITGTAEGRGTTYFFDWEGYKLVLRHYLRGGLVGKFNPDYYLNTKLEKTRPYQEWKVLCELQALGLPAPKPAGMRIVSGGLFYRADLLTHQIEGVTPLCDALEEQALCEGAWQEMGRTIRRFHDAGVYHDDLNCHNILLRHAESGREVFLIDFDKGKINQKEASWKQANLDRLLRSLNKEKGQLDNFNFNDEHWQSLLKGYQG